MLFTKDFCKAFDKIPHRRLLRKLEKYGIKGKLLYCIKDFLPDRQQRVFVKLDIYNIWSPTRKCPGDYTLSSLHK